MLRRSGVGAVSIARLVTTSAFYVCTCNKGQTHESNKLLISGCSVAAVFTAFVVSSRAAVRSYCSLMLLLLLLLLLLRLPSVFFFISVSAFRAPKSSPVTWCHTILTCICRFSFGRALLRPSESEHSSAQTSLCILTGDGAIHRRRIGGCSSGFGNVHRSRQCSFFSQELGDRSYCPNFGSGRLRSKLARVEAARVDQLSVPVAQLVRWFLLSLTLCTHIVAITDIASLSSCSWCCSVAISAQELASWTE